MSIGLPICMIYTWYKNGLDASHIFSKVWSLSVFHNVKLMLIMFIWPLVKYLYLDFAKFCLYLMYNSSKSVHVKDCVSWSIEETAVNATQASKRYPRTAWLLYPVATEADTGQSISTATEECVSWESDKAEPHLTCQRSVIEEIISQVFNTWLLLTVTTTATKIRIFGALCRVRKPQAL